MRTATKADLLSLHLRIEPVTIPGLNMQVFIREMNVAQREDYIEAVQSALADKTIRKNLSAEMLIHSIVNKNGETLFGQNDLEQLADINPQAITIMTTKMLEISGLYPAALEKEKKRLRIFQSIDLFSNWLRNLVRRWMK
jgi:hypothetical protein